MEERFVQSRPTRPKNGDRYTDKDGITFVFCYGRWKKFKNSIKKNSF